MRPIFFSLFTALWTLIPFSSLQAALIYSTDFETDDGGWTATNDWERGMPMGFMGQFSSTEPVGGHSGDMVFGTVIGGDHLPSTVSSLSMPVDLTGHLDPVLSFYEWSDSGGNTFDEANVLVNGTSIYLSDGDSGDAWRNVSLSLAPFSNTMVTIDFEFSTTDVVERTGWYIDDINISNIPEPSVPLLLTLAGLCCFRRRRV